MVAAFDEESDFGFGAGIAQEHSAFAVEVGLDGSKEALDFGQGLERRLVFHAKVALGLGIFFQDFPKFAEGLAGLDHHAEDLKGADNAVASGGVVTEDHVAALLATDIVALA